MVSDDELLETFSSIHDSPTGERQGWDFSSQYRSGRNYRDCPTS
ncbi:MAG: peptide-methionine (S)-S-oxide reductase [Solirubrobacterales bacterium]|nr:peptide-methionine (S)-S-oxide reductase [Solirubrobacterales bacterium]MBV9798135.1 peptide-methionine (S)-S-oxide reductase [Solirubrobacterales bacterium]